MIGIWSDPLIYRSTAEKHSIIYFSLSIFGGHVIRYIQIFKTFPVIFSRGNSMILLPTPPNSNTPVFQFRVGVSGIPPDIYLVYNN